MNKHVLRYIVEYIHQRGCVGMRFAELAGRDDVLQCFGFVGLLEERERKIVTGELLALAELERFKERHRSIMAIEEAINRVRA